MLIDPHTNLLHQWKQKQSLMDQLQNTANLPITSSSQQRDTLEKQFTDFVFQNSLDSLFGGLLVNCHEDQLNSVQQKYYKPAITNIYLAELLIAADQVLYDGSFSFIGNQIVEYLITQISNQKNKLLNTNRYTDLKNLNCFFSHSTLNGLLEGKELQLLLALTSPSPDKEVDSEYILLSYARPLRDAAANIDMHYKEAQIIEFGLLDKLKNSKHEKHFVSEPIENCFEVNCELLVILSKNLLNNYEPNIAKLAMDMFNKLYLEFLNESENRNWLINLIYTGIMLLQLEFDGDLVATIDQLILQLAKEPKTGKADEKSKYQETVIELFRQRRNIESNPSNVQLLFLSKKQIDLDTRLMELRARFNPHRLIFVV